tara:strand:- start:1085 stop:1873 length:789 start_codon:yes stop_codon:yes gene_type:complete
MDVTLIKYETVNGDCKLLKERQRRFVVIRGLKNRKQLFFRSFERIYLIRNIMKLHNLENVFHLEIDNLVYDDISKWISIFIAKEVKIAFMIDNHNRATFGACYFKNCEILRLLTDYLNSNYLNNLPRSWPNEMTAIWGFFKKNPALCYIMPSLQPGNSESGDTVHAIGEMMQEHYVDFDTVFDPSTYGVYLLGQDVYHTRGKIVLKKVNPFGYIKTIPNMEWIVRDGLKKPYIINEGSSPTLINNLHVHSKDLINGISKPYV